MRLFWCSSNTVSAREGRFRMNGFCWIIRQDSPGLLPRATGGRSSGSQKIECAVVRKVKRQLRS